MPRGDASRLPDNSYPTAIRAEVLRRYAAGESATALGREFKIWANTIIRWAKEADIHRPYAQARKLKSDQCDPPITDEILADILVRYADNEAWYKIARSHGWKGHSHARLQRALAALGVEFRDRATATRLATQHPDLSQMSRDAWWELYWSPQSRYPTVESVAQHLGTTRHTVTRYLKRVGLAVRTTGQQTAIEFRLGRRCAPNPAGFGDNVAFMRAANYARGYTQRPESIKKGVAARRRPVTRPCSWCAQPITRVRSRMQGERICCDAACGGKLTAWRRYHPNAPRPLIVDALRQLLGCTRPNEERLQRLAESAGAREPEILEALLDL